MSLLLGAAGSDAFRGQTDNVNESHGLGKAVAGRKQKAGHLNTFKFRKLEHLFSLEKLSTDR